MKIGSGSAEKRLVEKSVTDRRKEGRKDGRTEGQTDFEPLSPKLNRSARFASNNIETERKKSHVRIQKFDPHLDF